MHGINVEHICKSGRCGTHLKRVQRNLRGRLFCGIRIEFSPREPILMSPTATCLAVISFLALPHIPYSRKHITPAPNPRSVT